MALMDAKPFDEAAAKRRRNTISIVVFLVLLAAFTAWELRFMPEERAADTFFKQIEAQNFEGAYALWMADPNWKQHPEKYSRYPFNEFVQDWGPGSEYGAIKSHKVEGAGDPPMGRGSGVIVEVQINGRPVTAKVWVEKSDKSLGFPP
jgi:hypothetical protein